jgi:hypothetical protein
MIAALHHWLDRNLLSLARELRWSYLPPLMVYVAAGVSGLTGIVGTFFIKEYLDLSAAFLAAIGFWAGIPWALKMPMGHLVDLIWRYKEILVFVGAALIAASLLIMIGLIGHPTEMRAIMSASHWSSGTASPGSTSTDAGANRLRGLTRARLRTASSAWASTASPSA